MISAPILLHVKHSKYLQVFLLLQLYAGVILPLANAAPVNRQVQEAYFGQDEPKVLLNEVAMNYGLNSYIELYAPNGLTGDFFRRRHLGLITIRTQKRKRKNFITSIIHLKDPRIPPTPSTSTTHSERKFILICTSDSSWRW